MTKYKYTTARKYEGDDAYSWAIFDKRTRRPIMTGLTQRQLAYERAQIEQRLKARYDPA
tara:strand:- start:137 stop:313 length:177 start_codon:yes stop_codon:yes gene_type:complete